MFDQIRKSITFASSGVQQLIFDRQNTRKNAEDLSPYYITYLDQNVDQYFSDLILDTLDSGINGAYSIERDDGNSITVTGSGGDGIKRFVAGDIATETNEYIQRVRIYSDKAGAVDLMLWRSELWK